MALRTLVLATTLIWPCIGWAGLEVLQTGIALESATAPPQREVGSTRKYLKNGKPFESKVVESLADSVTYESSEGCNWTSPRLDLFATPSTHWTNCDGSSGRASVQHRSGTAWPMNVGNKWSFEVRGDSWTTNRDCEVADTARVRIGIGEFETFKVVCADRWNTRTYYYAPSVGTSVHWELHRRARAERTQYEVLEQ